MPPSLWYSVAQLPELRLNGGCDTIPRPKGVYDVWLPGRVAYERDWAMLYQVGVTPQEVEFAGVNAARELGQPGHAAHAAALIPPPPPKTLTQDPTVVAPPARPGLYPLTVAPPIPTAILTVPLTGHNFSS